MIIKSKKEIPAGEITDPLIFNQRRKIIKAFLASVAAGSGIATPAANSVSIGKRYYTKKQLVKTTQLKIYKTK